MNELVFEVTQEADGGYVAEALGEGVITQADTWEELRKNDREAMSAYFFDRLAPARPRLVRVSRMGSGRNGTNLRPVSVCQGSRIFILRQ